MIKRDSQFVTIIHGKEVSDRHAAAIENEIRSKYDNKVELTFIRGNQPVYYYIISVE
jgi:dihydroxyacetone kinase-like predicted kinase